MKRLLAAFLVALIAYAAVYAYLRMEWAQKRTLDGVNYVIYPPEQMWIYFLFRPAARIDNMATGMASHIGPHPEEIQQ